MDYANMIHVMQGCADASAHRQPNAKLEVMLMSKKFLYLFKEGHDAFGGDQTTMKNILGGRAPAWPR